MSDREAYIKGEFGELAGSTEFKIKIIGDNGETKWINATNENATWVCAVMTGQLSAAVDELRKAREAFNSWVDADSGANFEYLGGKVADAAGKVLDLLAKVGY